MKAHRALLRNPKVLAQLLRSLHPESEMEVLERQMFVDHEPMMITSVPTVANIKVAVDMFESYI